MESNSQDLLSQQMLEIDTEFDRFCSIIDSTLIRVEEQLIMSHQNLDGVRTYKRVSEEQCQQVSSVLNSATNCMEESLHQD